MMIMQLEICGQILPGINNDNKNVFICCYRKFKVTWKQTIGPQPSNAHTLPDAVNNLCRYQRRKRDSMVLILFVEHVIDWRCKTKGMWR